MEGVGTFKKSSAALKSFFTKCSFKTTRINKLEYGSEATFPISQCPRMNVEGSRLHHFLGGIFGSSWLVRIRHVWFSNFYYQNSCRTGSAIWTMLPSAFFWRISWNTRCHQHIAGWKKAFLHFGKVAENRNLTFPIRFRRADTTWNAKEKNDRVHTHFRSNCVCLNTQDSLRRVSEDGFTRKRTMLTF